MEGAEANGYPLRWRDRGRWCEQPIREVQAERADIATLSTPQLFILPRGLKLNFLRFFAQ